MRWAKNLKVYWLRRSPELLFIENSYGESYFYEAGKWLFGKNSIRRLIKESFSETLSLENKLYIFIGTDSGYLVEYFSDSKAKGARAIFIEIPEVIETVRKKYSHLLGDRIALLEKTEVDEDLFRDIYQGYFYIDSYDVIKSLSAQYGFIYEYNDYYWDVKTITEKVSFDTLLLTGQEAFLKNIILNCSYGTQHISSLKKNLNEKSFCLVAGGPSLDKCIDWIRRNRASIVLVAVSRVASRLYHEKIKPDLFVTVDPNDMNYLQSKDIFRFDSAGDVGLVYLNHTNNQLVSQWIGPKFFAGDLLPWGNELEELDQLAMSGPTVSNAALDLIAFLEANTLFLAGVDFCFSREGHTHESGSKERKSGVPSYRSEISIPTYGGRMAKSRPDFLLSMQVFEKQVLHYKNLEIISISDESARVEGVRVVESNQDQLIRKVDFSVVLKKNNVSNNEKEFLNSVKGELLERKWMASFILSNFQDFGLCNDQVYFESECLAIDPSVDTKKIYETYRIFKRIAFRDLTTFSFIPDSIESMSEKEVEAKVTKYNDIISAAGARFNNYLEQALAHTEYLLAEEDLKAGEVNESSMGKYAKAPNGRLRIFKNGSAGVLKNTDFSKKLDDFMSFLDKDVLIAERQRELKENIRGLPALIARYKARGDYEAIRDLYGAWSGYDGIENYLRYLRAVLAVADGKFSSVYEELLPVVQSEYLDEMLLEASLGEIANEAFRTDDLQVALDALAGLSIINPEHLLSYSELLFSNHQYADAIDHIMDYLRYFPRSSRAMLLIEEFNEKLNALTL